MGKSVYGQVSGPDNKGVTYTTSAKILETAASTASLSAIRTAALALEVAVSTSLIGSGTAAAAPVAAAGWMSGSKLAALSATYASVTSTIY